METTRRLSFMKLPTGQLASGKENWYSIEGAGKVWMLVVIRDGETVDSYLADRLKDAKALANRLETEAA